MLPNDPQPADGSHDESADIAARSIARWVRRVAISIVVLLVIAVVLRFWWGHSAQQRLDSLLAQYRAAGEPISIADFQPPEVPDDQNAALLLSRAVAQLPPCPSTTPSSRPS